jgi:hypothetical protein
MRLDVRWYGQSRRMGRVRTRREREDTKYRDRSVQPFLHLVPSFRFASDVACCGRQPEGDGVRARAIPRGARAVF